jgi:hypothetical protein
MQQWFDDSSDLLWSYKISEAGQGGTQLKAQH